MPKIIRVCVAGSESAGKTFLIGGITKVFDNNDIFKDFRCILKDTKRKNLRKGMEDIDRDIQTNIASGAGTPRQTDFLNGEYICDILGGSKWVKILWGKIPWFNPFLKTKILFRNIPGEMFNFYFSESKINGNDLNHTFIRFLDEDSKRWRLIKHLKNCDIQKSKLDYIISIMKKVNYVAKTEQMKTDFDAYLMNLDPAYYTTNSVPIAENFYSFLYYFLSTDLVICFNPTLTSSLISSQENLMGKLNSKILAEDESKKKYKVITQFDTYFSSPNVDYVRNEINSIKDYLNLSLKKINTIKNVIKSNSSKDDFSELVNNNITVFNMKSILSEFFKPNIENDVVKDVFLVCTKYRNTTQNRFPNFKTTTTSKTITDLFTESNYKSVAFPLGCFELIVSILLKNEVVKLDTMGIDLDTKKYESIIKAYFQ